MFSPVYLYLALVLALAQNPERQDTTLPFPRIDNACFQQTERGYPCTTVFSFGSGSDLQQLIFSCLGKETEAARLIVNSRVVAGGDAIRAQALIDADAPRVVTLRRVRDRPTQAGLSGVEALNLANAMARAENGTYLRNAEGLDLRIPAEAAEPLRRSLAFCLNPPAEPPPTDLPGSTPAAPEAGAAAPVPGDIIPETAAPPQ